MTKNKPASPTPIRKPAFITLEAYENLDDLCDILAMEKKITKHNYMDAISNAVIVEARRARARQARRQTREMSA